MITAPGFFPDMAADEYFADPCPTPSLTQSGIPTLLNRSPYHFAFNHPRLNPYGESNDATRAQWLGSAVHRLALGAGREISEIRYPDYSSSSARDARDLAISNGRIPVLSRELVRARDMAAIVRELIDEALGGAPYQTEIVIAWIEQTASGPTWCRAMVDVWCPSLGLALDPKVLRIPATAEAFGRTAADSGYDIQAAFYARGLSAVTGGRPVRFANLVIESAPPHGAQTIMPDASARIIAEAQVDRAIELFAGCLARRNWPSYPRGLQSYTTPGYYQNAIANQEPSQ
jgi:hypothetical protein